MLRRLVKRLLRRPSRSPTRRKEPTTPPASSTESSLTEPVAPVNAAALHPAEEAKGPSSPKRAQAHRLVLYKFDSCPYCRRVQRVLDQLDLYVEMRDTRTDPENHRVLFERTGRTQVPCLFIDDEPMFESADIVDWLETYALSA